VREVKGDSGCVVKIKLWSSSGQRFRVPDELMAPYTVELGQTESGIEAMYMLGVENSHALNDKSGFQEHLKRLVSERCSGNAGDDFVVASEKLNCRGVAEPCGLFPCPGVASIFVELDRRSHRFIN